MWIIERLVFALASFLSWCWTGFKWHWRDLFEPEADRARREDEANGDPIQW